MGVVTPLGIDIPTFWNNLVEGKSGIGRVTQIDVAQYDCKIGGEVKDFEPPKYFKSSKDARRADRYSQLAMGAAKLAWADAASNNHAETIRIGNLAEAAIGPCKLCRSHCELGVAIGAAGIF